MATDGKTPAPCDKEVFKKGKPVALLDGSSNAVENWVREVAKKANVRIDWHYSGGIAQVLHLGDRKSRQRAEETIKSMPVVKNPTVLRCIPADSPGLYRRGVTDAPSGAIAGFMGLTGKQAYIVKKEE